MGNRCVWGLPPWGFWVTTIVLTAIVANAPFIGPPLGAAILIAATVVYLRTPRQNLLAPYIPIPQTGTAELVVDRLEVVGESNYLGEIALVVGAAGRDLTAQLYWESKNPWDPNGKAVKVYLVDGNHLQPCGYLPVHIAPTIQPIVKSNADKGLATTTPATVFGGTADKPNYGVILGSGVIRGRRRPEFR